jgi:hypothetical protein
MHRPSHRHVATRTRGGDSKLRISCPVGEHTFTQDIHAGCGLRQKGAGPLGLGRTVAVIRPCPCSRGRPGTFSPRPCTGRLLSFILFATQVNPMAMLTKLSRVCRAQVIPVASCAASVESHGSPLLPPGVRVSLKYNCAYLIHHCASPLYGCVVTHQAESPNCRAPHGLFPSTPLT